MDARERDMAAVKKFFTLEIGRAQRAIMKHQPHAKGWCLGCGCVRYTVWPCWLFTLASDAVTAHDKAVACAEFVDALIPRQRVVPVMQTRATRSGALYWNRNVAPPYVRKPRPLPQRLENGRFIAQASELHSL